MLGEISCKLKIDNIIPHADKASTQAIIELWHEAALKCERLSLQCVHPGSGRYIDLLISVDLSSVLHRMNSAQATSRSFDDYRGLHVEDSDNPVDAEIVISLSSEEPFSAGEAYRLSTTIQQQLFIALNFAYPGACQMLGVNFEGPNSHLYEAQSFDSKVFYDAQMSSRQQSWPPLTKLRFEQAWNWVDKAGLSRSDTAISELNKVLFNFLKIAQQRHRYGSRSALLVVQQVESLLGKVSAPLVRERCKLILGGIPEAADCFIELFQLRRNIFEGKHPVRRPALICHTKTEENREQIAAHNSCIELASSIVVALLQMLIINNTDKFKFKEILV